MLIASGLPRSLWGEALLHAIWLKNRTSTKALNGRTPYEALTGSPPDMSGVPVWGSQVWVHDDSSGKVGVRAIAARWVGFDTQTKGHRVYWPERRTVTVERNVRFAAPNLPAPFADDDAELEEEEDADEVKPASPVPDEPVAEPPVPEEPRAAARPTRVRPPSQRVRDILQGKAADKKLPRGVQVQELPEEEEAVEKGERGADEGGGYGDRVPDVGARREEVVGDAEEAEGAGCEGGTGGWFVDQHACAGQGARESVLTGRRIRPGRRHCDRRSRATR